MTNSDLLFERRQAVVPQGVGIFNRATIVSAKDALLIDADGHEILDFSSGIGVTTVGHCPQPVVDAIREQAGQYLHTCFHVATYEPYLQLCEKLVSLLPHGERTKALLTNCGAEAVENAVKIARQATRRKAVVAFTEAFHGRTLMAMSLTSKIDYKINCGPFAPEVYRLRYPNDYYYNDGLSSDAFVKRELGALEHFFKNTVDPKDVAAVIIEPIQGEGGFVVAPFEYLQGLRKVCDKHGILLICDEVQSGFCRTGKWGAYEHSGITPDLSTWAKAMGGGLPIGAVVGKAEIMDAAKPGTIGGTYLGNPVCCAASLAAIRFMQENNLMEKAIVLGERMQSHFIKLQQKCPAIGEVRGLGAMVAFELVRENNPEQPDTELCVKLITACLQRGLLILSAGTYKNVVRLLPPLTISDELLERGLAIIEEELLNL
jgi:4-aminobutyrate aminotransferase/(S)-3-amino-2-methylpropionate transaminase